MSDNPMLDSLISEKDQIIIQLQQRIEQLEMEKKNCQDNVFSQAQSVTNDYIKQTQSIIAQIQTHEYQMDDFESRIDDDEKLQIQLKSKEDDFCPQCKELYKSINRSIHNKIESKKQSIDAKFNLIKLRDQEFIKLRSIYQQAVELIESKDLEIQSKVMEIKVKDMEIKSKEAEINKYQTNLQAQRNELSQFTKIYILKIKETMEIKVLSIHCSNIQTSQIKNKANIQFIENVQFISDINQLQFYMNDDKIIVIKLPQEIIIQLNQLELLKKQQQEADIMISKMNAQIELLKNQLFNNLLQKHEIMEQRNAFEFQIQQLNTGQFLLESIVKQHNVIVIENSQIDNQIERYVLELSSKIRQNDQMKSFFLKIKDLINSFKIDEIS